jgi:alkylation response protein AidB-like acyl-CoA dehydrogenase
MQRWAKILGRQGWLGYGWPQAVRRPGLERGAETPVRRRMRPGRCAAHRALRPGDGGPGDHGLWQRRAAAARFLPGIASGEVWWSQGYSEPGAGSDLASAEDPRRAQGDHYIVNGQKTWTTLGQYGDWIFCLVRTSTEGKPQTGISFLLIDMKSPGVTCAPSNCSTASTRSTRSGSTTSKVPAENLIGEENKGWTYAKHLLSHERTNIADVNRAKRELERLKRIAKAEGVWDDLRFRDQIALLEVDIVALEMLVLRVLSAEKSGKQAWTSPAC